MLRRTASAPARLNAWLLLCIFALAAAMACSGGNGNHPAGPAAARDIEAAPPAAKSWAGKDAAPDFPAGLQWFNVARPLTLADLRGKVVVLDFWTLGCINCQHIIPDLKRLEAEFGDSLAVVGVHSGKYAEEHAGESVREAVRRYGLTHPVVNDPEFAFWNRYGADAWPTLVIVDPDGRLVGRHAGEGVYPLFQPIVKSLVDEFAARGGLSRTPLPLALDAAPAATILSYPAKALADERGRRLFVADSGHNRILQADLDGRLQAAYGSGKEGFADGAAGEAAFRQPQGLALSTDGATLYVADTRNHAVRAIALATGEVTTVAGTGAQLERLPAPGADPRKTALASPWDLVAIGQTLYIAMAGVHQLWSLDLAHSAIAVYAGTSREGLHDGPRRAAATLAQPSGIATDGTTLYWVDPEASAVRMVAAGAGEDAEVETLVGTGLFDYGDNDGQGRAAKLQHPQGIAVAGGTLYVADTYNHRLRAIDLVSHNVTTLAGSARGWADGRGTAAKFDEPTGLSAAGGRLYVADTNNQLVRVADIRTGEVSTLQLPNLGVLSPATPGRKEQVTLPPVTVAPGVGSVRLTVAAPAGYHLNSQGPSTLTLTTSNPSVVEPGERSLSFASDEAEVRLPVPANFGPGSATLTARAAIYYCREGEEALCFIQQAEITLPVSVSPSATTAEVPFTYSLPPRPGPG